MEKIANGTDSMIRVVMQNPAIRMALGSFAALGAEAIRRHDADPISGRLLADALSTSALMTVLLGDGEKYSIKIQYEGPAGTILVDANADGRMRGLVSNPHVMTLADSVEVACGNGCMVTVTKSRDGRILNSGETRSSFVLPDAALGYFLSVSDQIETEIATEIQLKADVDYPVATAGGILIQAMPGCDLMEFDRIRNRLVLPETEEILRSPCRNPEDRLKAFLNFLLERLDLPEYTVTSVEAPRFTCGCSAQNIKQTAIRMLGKEDAAKLLEENPNPAIRCQFCQTEYHLSAEDLD